MKSREARGAPKSEGEARCDPARERRGSRRASFHSPGERVTPALRLARVDRGGTGAPAKTTASSGLVPEGRASRTGFLRPSVWNLAVSPVKGGTGGPGGVGGAVLETPGRELEAKRPFPSA